MRELYIIRHGETDFNKDHRMQGRGTDASLNDEGREQAVAILDFLAEKPVNLVVTSSLKRTLESAQPLADHHKARMLSFPELDEMDFGNLEGREFHSVKQDLVMLHDEWSRGNTQVPTPEGEHPEEVFNRANAKVQQLLKEEEGPCVAFVLHGRLIRILLSVWLGHGLQNMHKIEHTNGAINHLTWDGSEFKAVELNITAHLDKTLKE